MLRARSAAMLGALLCVSGVLVSCGASPSSSTACAAVPALSMPANTSATTDEAVIAAARTALGSGVTVSLSLSEASLFGAACKAMHGEGSFWFGKANGKAAGTEWLAPGVGDPGRAPGTQAYSLIYRPPDLYLRLPTSQSRLLPAGRPWVHAIIASSSVGAEGARSFFTQVINLSPELVLFELEVATTSAEEVGPVQVGSTAATEYDVAVNLDDAASSVGSSLAGPLAAAAGVALRAEAAATPGPQGAPAIAAIEVALDARGRLAQVRFEPAGARLGVVTMTFAALRSRATTAPPSPPALDTVGLSRLLPHVGEGSSAGEGSEPGEGGGG